MDMEQEAVQVRPLRQITGEAEFNELFIEEARIPDANVVGGVGNGWKVALTTLMNERAGLGFALQVRLRQQLDDLFAAAAERGLLEDPLVADALADLHVRTRVDPAAGLEGPDRHRALRPARARGLAGQVAVVGHQPAAHAARRRHRRARGADRRDAVELRAAARPRQHDRGRHHRGAQEHRRRARARPPATEGGGVAMDFGLTDDQRDIQRTARELLADARDARARARARRGARAPTTRCGSELARARLARHRGRRGARRPGPRRRRAGDPLRGARPQRSRPSRSCRPCWPRR